MGRLAIIGAAAGLLTACAGGEPVEKIRRSRGHASSALSTDPVMLSAALGVPRDSLRAAGEERYARQSYDSAMHILRVEAARAVAAHDARAETRARMWIGLAAWRLGDYAAARREGEAALSMKRRLGLDAELSRSFNALGLLAWNEGRYADALEQFDSALVTARRHADTAGVARAAANIPLVKVELGDFGGAGTGLRRALALGVAIGDRRMQGNALANLAMLEIRLGRPAEAVPLVARARSQYSSIGYATGESNALGQLATAWAQLGDLQRAIATADSALVIARARGLQQEIASELEVIADLHLQAGSPRLALRKLVEADSLDRILGLASERGVNQRRMAVILLALGDPATSASHARQAMALHARAGALVELVHDRLQLATSLARVHEMAGALAQLDSAQRDASPLHNPVLPRDIAMVTARLALEAGEPRRALASLGVVPNRGRPPDWRMEDLEAEALFAAGRLDDARRAAERAVGILERERASLGVGPLRSTYLASRDETYSRLVAIHLARNDTVSAFRVAASLPGRRLAERLGGLTTVRGPITAMASGERLLLRAAALELELTGVPTGPRGLEQRRTLEHALETTRAAYEEHLVHWARVPDGEGLGITAVDLRVMQSKLQPHEALLSFVTGPERTDLFVVRTNRVLHRGIGLGNRHLAERVRVVRDLLAGGRTALLLPALNAMHQILLGSVIEQGGLAGATQLFIVPHGSLTTLPFAGLRNQRSGRFLVEDHVVRYLPNAAVLMHRALESALPPGRMVAFAPFSDSLPGTDREVREVGRTLGGTQIRLGKTSSEASVRAALREGASVHIASHGVSNARNPMFSRIMVGRSARDGAEDGVLTAHEILELTVHSPLVFLSGCETGVTLREGAFSPGIEESSLAQALLIAGARSVVATLWRVDDAGAARIAVTFYRHLRGGVPPDESLARAQREAIRSGADFTWGAYTISGMAGANRALAAVKLDVTP